MIVHHLRGSGTIPNAIPLEGKSLRAIFDGKPHGRDFIFWEHEGNRAVRAGSWKLVAKHNQPWELYDIAADRVEANDLAAKEPAKVKELAARYAEYAKRSQVENWPVANSKK